MKKKRLEVNFGFDFSLIGLTSTIKPHKLAWELNNALKLDLNRIPDYALEAKDGEILLFLNFLHKTDLTTIRLFKNRQMDNPASKWLLVPEYPHFDYIILADCKEMDLTEEIVQALKNIPTIELSACLPLATLKSKENFIF